MGGPGDPLLALQTDQQAEARAFLSEEMIAGERRGGRERDRSWPGTEPGSVPLPQPCPAPP